jgi:D-inositol-3-phosphate glycosyltransferase
LRDDWGVDEMLIFASLDDPCPTRYIRKEGAFPLYGASVSAENFYQALLRYGNFDEYHFFLEPSEIPVMKKKLREGRGIAKRLKILPRGDFPAYLQSVNYTILFTSNPFLRDLAYFRRQYAQRYFPLCGMWHTTSYPELLEDAILANLRSDLRPFDSLICTTPAQRQAVQNLFRLAQRSFSVNGGVPLSYRGRLDLLPLGIDTGEYAGQDRWAARAKLDLPQDSVLILYFGRFSVVDKMDLYPLLHTFKLLSQQERKILLLCAGSDGPSRYGKALRRVAQALGIAPAVKFFWNPSQGQKKLLFAASDIFVSPSDNLQESFGLTILEAMAAGLAIVASDWNGYKHLIRHAEDGLLIPTYWAPCNSHTAYTAKLLQGWGMDQLYLSQSVCVDVQTMYESLRCLIQDRELRLRLGERARQKVRKEFDWEPLIISYERLWKRLSILCQEQKISSAVPPSPVLIPSYYECYAHYATRTLSDRMSIISRPQGMECLKHKRLPPIPRGIQGVISSPLLWAMMALLRNNHAMTVGSLVRSVKALFPNQTMDRIRYNVMWALKMDLMGLGARQAPSGTASKGKPVGKGVPSEISDQPEENSIRRRR